jgi:hypothetical protein
MAQDPSLRIKYLDWCSAKIAEHIFALDPDGFWLLSQKAGEASRVPAGAGASMSGGDEIVETLVGTGEPAERLRQMILAVHRELDLPDEESWTLRYRADPHLYERDMLGFRPAYR